MASLIRTAIVSCCFLILTDSVVAQDKDFEIIPGEGKLVVNLRGKLFTQYDYASYKKPILYPLIADGGVEITRNYPMKKVAGEANDHPHHKSVWFAHGDINGLDFWSEKAVIKSTRVEVQKNRNGDPFIQAESSWMKNENDVLFESNSLIRFAIVGTTRFVGFDIELKATTEDLTFGDTKEGTFAIRTDPNLRLTNDEKHGVTGANGTAVNSEGVTGKDVWGKNASWIDYSGNIDGEMYGIAILDHPDNLRHPTTWHAREYGLVAANPFGLHHFQGKPKGTGNHVVKKGESLKFQYLVVIHRGDASQADIAGAFSKWSQGQ